MLHRVTQQRQKGTLARMFLSQRKGKKEWRFWHLRFLALLLLYFCFFGRFLNCFLLFDDLSGILSDNVLSDVLSDDLFILLSNTTPSHTKPMSGVVVVVGPGVYPEVSGAWRSKLGEWDRDPEGPVLVPWLQEAW